MVFLALSCLPPLWRWCKEYSWIGEIAFTCGEIGDGAGCVATGGFGFAGDGLYRLVVGVVFGSAGNRRGRERAFSPFSLVFFF